MKKYIILLGCIWIINNAKGQTLYDSLSNLNLDHYASLPVDSILKAIPQSYTDLSFIGSLKSDNLLGLSIYYADNTNIWIKPRKYNFMQRNDPARIWNLNLFKKETASYILIMFTDNHSPIFGQFP